MRVFHLIDEAAVQACPTTLALIAQSPYRDPQNDDDVLLIGSDHLAAEAMAAGLNRFQRVNAPFGKATAAFPAVAARLTRPPAAQLIHCWSFGVLAVATLVRPLTPKLLHLNVPPSPRQWQWLAWLLRRVAGRRVLIICPHQPLHDELSGLGVKPTQLEVVPPGLDPGMLQDDRATLRERWGLGDSEAKVVALLSDPPDAADTRVAVFAVGLACESLASWSRDPLQYEHRLLVHPLAEARLHAQRMMNRFGTGWRILQEPELALPWRMLSACDVGLSLGRHMGGPALAWARLAGVPVVAERRSATEAMIRHDEDGLLAEAGKPKRLAYQLQRLLADHRFAEQVGQAGRDSATERCNPSEYRRLLEAIYGSLLKSAASPSASVV